MKGKRRLPACLLAGAALALPGCYTHVIERDGIAAKYEGGTTYKPNIKKGESIYDTRDRERKQSQSNEPIVTKRKKFLGIF